MIRLFAYALAAIALVLLAVLFTDFPADPGYLLVAVGSYTFETSLLALILAAAAGYLLYRLLRMLLAWVNPLRWVRLGRRAGKLLRPARRGSTEEGMLALFQGNWQPAYNLLMQGSGEAEGSVANYLAAACAAHQLRQPELVAHCLEAAERQYPHSRATAQLLRARLLQRDGHAQQALQVVDNLRRSAASDSALLGLLKQLYLDLEDWDELEKLLRSLERSKTAPSSEILRLRQQILAERLHAVAVGREANLDHEQARASLRQLWNKAPSDFHNVPQLASLYARSILLHGGTEDAALALEHALAASWNRELIDLYGHLALGDDMRRLNLAEAWLEQHREDASLHLALGRLCLRNELWGKARNYLQTSINHRASAAAHGELSRLLENLGESAASRKHLDRYRELAAEPLPALPQPLSPTGAAAG